MKKSDLLVFLIAFGLLIGSPVFSNQADAQFGRAIRHRGPTVATRNFVVTGPTESYARKVAREAERFRKELSLEWLGYEIKPWSQKCPIVVKIEAHAGGVTRFGFERGLREPVGWEMEIFGPPDRILDSVLPHEVTHTIFATHFGRPLPRWADEGACTTVEHQSEKNKNHRMLIRFLSSQPSRGIPFNRMFSMREYPHDILPLYAQGYSVAKFLIQQKGKREFIRYVETGLRYEDRGEGLSGWGRATKEIYEYADLSDLQIKWVTWVKQGSPPLNAIAKADTDRQPDSSRLNRSKPSTQIAAVNPASEILRNASISNPSQPTSVSGNWYVRQAASEQSVPETSSAQSQTASGATVASSFDQLQHPLANSVNATSYRPGSIADSKPLKMVADSAFRKPDRLQAQVLPSQVQPTQNSLGNSGLLDTTIRYQDPRATQRSNIDRPDHQMRSRPTIYR